MSMNKSRMTYSFFNYIINEEWQMVQNRKNKLQKNKSKYLQVSYPMQSTQRSMQDSHNKGSTKLEHVGRLSKKNGPVKEKGPKQVFVPKGLGLSFMQ